MPIYEYRCTACGERVEVLVRSHTATPICPMCGCPLTDRRQEVGRRLHPRGTGDR